MPYEKSNSPTRIKGLPKHAQEIWISAYNSAWKTYDPEKARAEGREAYANSVAWGAVKKKYVKKNGRWVSKEARVAATEAERKVAEARSEMLSRSIADEILPGRLLASPHGELIQQYKKKAILSTVEDKKHIKIPVCIVQGDKVWAKVVLAPPVAITVADFRESRAEHRVSDAEIGRWGWRGQQLYLYYFQSVKAYDPPLEIEELEGAPCWVESVAFKPELIEEARHRRDHCMRCDAKPTKQVLWAEGKAIAWFCEECLKQWHKEGDGWHAVDKLITVDGEALSTEEFKKIPDELKPGDPLMETIMESFCDDCQVQVAHRPVRASYTEEGALSAFIWACTECGFECAEGLPGDAKEAVAFVQKRMRALEASLSREVIKKVGDKWELWSRDGTKRLGTFKTKEDAQKRERQIQFFKHMRGAVVPEPREMASHLESLTKEEIYWQGRGEGRIETLWELQDALPPESQVTLASGFDAGLRVLLEYIEQLKARAEERKTS